jgi:hypothetical protein
MLPCFHATVRSCTMTKSPDQASSPRNMTLVSAWIHNAHASSPTSPPDGRPRVEKHDRSSGRSVRQRDSRRDLRATICEFIALALEEVPGEGMDAASAQRGPHLPSPSRRPPRDNEGATN